MTIRRFLLAVALLVPVSASAQTSAICAAVYDSNATRVGRADLSSSDPSAVVLLQNQGSLVTLLASKTALTGSSALFFTEPNCAGDAYMEWGTDLHPTAHLVSTDLWHFDPSAVPTSSVDIRSIRAGITGSCNNLEITVSPAYPAINLTLPSFTPPFHLEPEDCSLVTVASLGPRALMAVAVLLAFGAVVRVRGHGTRHRA